jgi:hypothetical protein
MRMPYAVGALGPGQNPGVVCGPEGHGPVVVSRAPYASAPVLVPGPGGCMALVADPSSKDLWAIMGCFEGFKFRGGGIYRIRDAGEPQGEEAAAERVFDLPFAHRIGLVQRGASRFLVAANIASDKVDAADWSKSGAVWAARIGADGAAQSPLQPILPDLHRNHGFLLSRFEDRQTLLIGAAEGLIAIDIDAAGSEWPARQVLHNEVSEVAAFDLDRDGNEELVTIEPFHGNVLRAYRKSSGRWEPFWETEISFGHCVLAGSFAGSASVLVSNRSGSRDLLLFQFDPNTPSKPKRFVVDEGVGAANMLVLQINGVDHIFSANQAAGEVALYAVKVLAD